MSLKKFRKSVVGVLTGRRKLKSMDVDDLDDGLQVQDDPFDHSRLGKTEFNISCPALLLSLSGEFQREIFSYITVKMLFGTSWIEQFTTSTAAHSRLPIYQSAKKDVEHKITCFPSFYTSQKVRFEIFEEKISGTGKWTLLAAVETTVIELVKQKKLPILRGDELVGKLKISSKLVESVVTLAISRCNVAAFSEKCPISDNIRDANPSLWSRSVSYNLTFNGTKMWPFSDFRRGYLTVEVLAGSKDDLLEETHPSPNSTTKSGPTNLVRLWMSMPIYSPYNLKTHKLLKIAHSTLLTRELDVARGVATDKKRKVLIVRVNHVYKVVDEFDSHIKTRTTDIASHCTFSIAHIVKAAMKSESVHKPVAMYRRLTPVTNSRNMSTESTTKPNHTSSQGVTKPGFFTGTLSHLLQSQSLTDLALTSMQGAVPGDSQTSGGDLDKETSLRELSLHKLLKKVAERPQEKVVVAKDAEKKTALTHEHVDDEADDAWDFDSMGKGDAKGDGSVALDVGERAAKSGSVVSIDKGKKDESDDRLGLITLHVEKVEEWFNVLRGDDAYERELRDRLKKMRFDWKKRTRSEFVDACEEESISAKKISQVLQAVQDGYRLKTAVLVDLADLCERSRDHQSGMQPPTPGALSASERISLIDVLEVIYNETAPFSEDDSMRLFAGGGVKPPSGDHPATGYCRNIGFPLIQELLVPAERKGWVSKSTGMSLLCYSRKGQLHQRGCFSERNGEDSQTRVRSTPTSRQIDGLEDDAEDTYSQASESISADRDVITAPAPPHPTTFDANGQLRAYLAEKGDNSWGGREYAFTNSYRSVPQFKQGLLEAAFLYDSWPYSDIRDQDNAVRQPAVNMDIEGLSQLLVTPSESDEFKIVTWILTRCPSAEVLQKTQDLMQFMSERKTGKVVLLVILMACDNDSGNGHDGDPAYPFKAFDLMLEVVLRNDARFWLPDDSVDDASRWRKERIDALDNDRTPYWKQQILQTQALPSRPEVSTEVMVASPCLFVYHFLSWDELVARAIAEDSADPALKTHDTKLVGTCPTTQAIINQLKPILSESAQRAVLGDLPLIVKEKLRWRTGWAADVAEAEVEKPARANFIQFRELRKRYESVMKAQMTRRLHLFVLEVLYGGLTSSINL